MKKQFLKSAAILSLAVTAVSTSQPVAGITKDYNNRNEKVKKYLQENNFGHKIAYGWKNKVEFDFRYLLDTAKYLVNKEEFQDPLYSDAREELISFIFPYEKFLINNRDITKLTVNQYEAIVNRMSVALQKFSKNIFEKQKVNKDLIPIAFWIEKSYRTVGTNEIAASVGIQGGFYQNFHDYYNYSYLLNSLWYEGNVKEVVKDYENTIRQILSKKHEIEKILNQSTSEKEYKGEKVNYEELRFNTEPLTSYLENKEKFLVPNIPYKNKLILREEDKYSFEDDEEEFGNELLSYNKLKNEVLPVNITTSTILKPFEQKKIVEDFNPYSNLDNLEIKKIRLNGSQKQKVEQEKTKSPTPQKEAVKEQTEQKISGKTQNVEKKSETVATPQQSSTAQTSVQQPAPVQPVVQESKASQEEINAAHDAISAYKSTVNIANTAGVTTAEMTSLINTQTSNLSDVEKALGNNKVNNGAVNVLREDTSRLENMIWNRAYQAIEEFNVARNTYNNQMKSETVPVDNDIEAILAGSQAKISHLDNRIGARHMDQAFVASLLEVTEMSKSISSRIKE
ncbi:hypothetical protein [Streptococcus agalactiae]|uniref:hypothetical protein n=1 Tax=Streptococcus agalactiae TaxID=1311 RepID=UPI0028162E8C|nr:hypothetical protein [Streptococcus agalactiae]WMU01168.1 hypothetical protein NQD67_04570 [Streptococcus agalactiae]